MQRSSGDDKSTPEPAPKHGIREVCGAATAVVGELPPVCQPAKAATIIAQRVKRVPLHKLRWNVAVTGVVTALVIAACWIAYDRRPASPLGHPVATEIECRSAAGTIRTRKAGAVAPRVQGADRGGWSGRGSVSQLRVQAGRGGPNEIDYITEDVTIRHFTTKPALPRLRGGYKEAHIGEDVTVRYFASKLSVVSQTRPASTAAQSSDRSLPVSK